MTEEPVRDSLVKNAELVRGNTISLNDLLRCADERDALRVENERLKAEFRKEFEAEHAAYTELRREIERLKRIIAGLHTASG